MGGNKSWCFIYKGKYEANKIAGVEARYISLSEQYVSRGDIVKFISRSKSDAHTHIRNLIDVLKTIYSSNYIVIHGGGPILLSLLAIFSVFFKKTIVLDAYAPHWLELYCSAPGKITLRRKIKIGMNISRIVWGGLFFHTILVANQRQLDLVRGFLAGVGLLDRLSDIEVLTTGCPEKDHYAEGKTKSNSQLSNIMKDDVREEHVYVGWIGGMWDWFDVGFIYKALGLLSEEYRRGIRLVYFGLSRDKEQEITNLSRLVKVKSIFVDWVCFDERIQTWSQLDAAFVWSEQTLENEYASRTRNFDCISAGLPIIQNYDDFWGPLIRENDIGYVVGTEKELSDVFLEIIKKEDLKAKRNNILNLYEKFSWTKISFKLQKIVEEERREIRSILSIILAICYLPIIILSSLALRK